MKIIYLNGGYLNELGPFEENEEISVPQAMALQLIEQGLALHVPLSSARPLTITLANIGLESSNV